MLNEEYSFHQRLTEVESAPFGKSLKQNDLRQTKRMKLENIFAKLRKGKLSRPHG